VIIYPEIQQFEYIKPDTAMAKMGEKWRKVVHDVAIVWRR
jgi:hypothetical protein